MKLRGDEASPWVKHQRDGSGVLRRTAKITTNPRLFLPLGLGLACLKGAFRTYTGHPNGRKWFVLGRTSTPEKSSKGDLVLAILEARRWAKGHKWSVTNGFAIEFDRQGPRCNV
jgi:hypothetical protein